MLPGNVQAKHLARALGFAEPEMFDASHRLEEFFYPTFISHKGSKPREIDPPTQIGKWRLQRLGKFISQEIRPHPCAHGSVEGRSAFTAAQVHLGDRHIISRDVENCYPSTDPDRFQAEMIALGFRHDVAILLTRFLLYKKRLPQGSPASNAALNLYLFRTDERIRVEAAKFGGRYTRYCDDLVISVKHRGDIAKAEALLEDALAAVGYKVNARKRARIGVQIVGDGERIVNGVVTNSSRHTRLPVAQIAFILEQCGRFLRSARSVSPSSIVNLARRRRRLGGIVNYVGQAGDSPANEMQRLLRLGDEAVFGRVRSAGLDPHKKCWWIKNQVMDEAVRLAASWAVRKSAVDSTTRFTVSRAIPLSLSHHVSDAYSTE